uniref:Sodium/nucleoside cotransporter n=1 Tax=Mola mola TaxID=94237 RepID=A0A3Q4BDW1_MOLML
MPEKHEAMFLPSDSGMLILVFVLGCFAVVIAACVLNFHRAVGLLVIALMTVFFLVWDCSMKRYGDRIWEAIYPVRNLLSRNWFWIRCYCAQYIVLLFKHTPKMSFFCTSSKWSFRTLLWGMGLQFFLALLSFRTTFGLQALQWTGHQAEIFLAFTDVGSKFVFGESYTEHPFVFKVMPILVFLSSVISILYYIGFMPWLICKIGFIMQATMGTSPTESVAAAGNIFLGQTDSVLLIRPYLSKLTRSEIHAVMTGGFAGLSGTILGVYISFGVEATHLLTASVMSAPASLAIAKMFWPETETSSLTDNQDLKIDRSTNILEAASQGATSAVGLVATIVANLIAFMALLAFFDAVLSWFGGLLDCPQLSFSLISSYMFMPLSFMMGVSWEDCFIVAELIGIKTFINEFVAYQKLSVLIKRRKAGGPEYVNNIKQYISVHSETIATYALCGFSNFASLGMLIGALSSMAPNRRTDISSCGFRSLIAGSVSCFMTACIAGDYVLLSACLFDYIKIRYLL